MGAPGAGRGMPPCTSARAGFAAALRAHASASEGPEDCAFLTHRRRVAIRGKNQKTLTERGAEVHPHPPELGGVALPPFWVSLVSVRFLTGSRRRGGRPLSRRGVKTASAASRPQHFTIRAPTRHPLFVLSATLTRRPCGSVAERPWRARRDPCASDSQEHSGRPAWRTSTARGVGRSAEGLEGGPFLAASLDIGLLERRQISAGESRGVRSGLLRRTAAVGGEGEEAS